MEALSLKRYHNEASDIPTLFNGSAYGDIDNDGGLDLITNNVNIALAIYENLPILRGSNYISIALTQESTKRDAIGAKIRVSSGDSLSILHHVQPAREFQSSVDKRINIELSSIDLIDINVIWPDPIQTVINGQSKNQRIVIQKESAEIAEPSKMNKDDVLLNPDNVLS